MAKFANHSEIDSSTYSYMQTVTGESDLSLVPIEDINSFLEGLESVIASESKGFPTEEDFASMEMYYGSLSALQS